MLIRSLVSGDPNSASRLYRDDTMPTLLLPSYSRRQLTAILFHCISTSTYTPRTYISTNHDNAVFIAFIRPYYFYLLEEYMLCVLTILMTKLT